MMNLAHVVAMQPAVGAQKYKKQAEQNLREDEGGVGWGFFNTGIQGNNCTFFYYLCNEYPPEA